MNKCPTTGCPGDSRYSAPGRHHMPGCTYPFPFPFNTVEELEEAEEIPFTPEEEEMLPPDTPKYHKPYYMILLFDSRGNKIANWITPNYPGNVTVTVTQI